MPIKPLTRELRESGPTESSIDPAEPIFRDVKVLGSVSQNRRRYTLEAKQAALPMYEGIKVNLNHPGNPQASRGIEDRFGKLFNVHLEGEDLKGDLRYNPKHPLAEAVRWWAENEPDCLGLSHNAVGQGHDENGVFVVEKIVAVRSVDLVADPATNKGLYEGVMPDAMNDMPAAADASAVPADDGADFRDHLFNAFKSVQSSDPGMANKILAMLKIQAKESGEADGEENDEEGLGDIVTAPAKAVGKVVGTAIKASPVGAAAQAYKTASTGYDSDDKDAKESVKLVARYRSRDKLLSEAKLPGHLLTPIFLESLLGVDDRAMKALIEDRKQVGSIQRPRSASPAAGRGVTMDAKTFVQQLQK